MLTIITLATLIAASGHSLLGISVDTSPEGVYVTSVSEGSTAAPFVRPGDRIVSINGEQILSEAALASVLSQIPAGLLFPLVVERAGIPSTHAIMLPVPFQRADGNLHLIHDEERPRTGKGLLVPGSIMTALGVCAGAAAGIWFSQGVHEDAGGVVIALAAGGIALLGAGIPMTIVGASQLRQYEAWVAEQQHAGIRSRPGDSRMFKLSMRF